MGILTAPSGEQMCWVSDEYTEIYKDADKECKARGFSGLLEARTREDVNFLNNVTQCMKQIFTAFLGSFIYGILFSGIHGKTNLVPKGYGKFPSNFCKSKAYNNARWFGRNYKQLFTTLHSHQFDSVFSPCL